MAEPSQMEEMVRVMLEDAELFLEQFPDHPEREGIELRMVAMEEVLFNLRTEGHP
jgi:hypothetical protein